METLSTPFFESTVARIGTYRVICCSGLGLVGDINGNGYPDVSLAAWQSSAVAPIVGMVYIYSGHDDTLLPSATGTIEGVAFGR